MSSRPPWSIQRAPDQPGLHSESCPERQNPASRPPQGSPFALWRAGRTVGRRAGGGGRCRGAGARAAAPPEVPARPPARPGRPRRRPRGRADRASRCPAGELSRGMQRGRRPRLCYRSSLLGRLLLPSPTSLLRPSLLVLPLPLSSDCLASGPLLPFFPPLPALVPPRQTLQSGP